LTPQGECERHSHRVCIGLANTLRNLECFHAPLEPETWLSPIAINAVDMELLKSCSIPLVVSSFHPCQYDLFVLIHIIWEASSHSW
jgi:hypothetical protein